MSNSTFSDYVLINTVYITSSLETHLIVVRTMGTKDLESDASGSIAAVQELSNLSYKQLIFSHKAERTEECSSRYSSYMRNKHCIKIIQRISSLCDILYCRGRE
jgi:hypothetical protein